MKVFAPDLELASNAFVCSPRFEFLELFEGPANMANSIVAP